MKRGLYIVLALTALVRFSSAQTTKTGVLVVGNGNNAIGAGIQSAVSGVKTIILLPSDGFELSPLSKNLNSGIAAEFLKRLRSSKGIKDSLVIPEFNNAEANAVLKIWTDSLKNLSLIKGTGWIKLKRSGSGWNMELKDGRKLKAEVLVNADGSGKIDKELNLQKTENLWQTFNYGDNLYRTSIAAGYFNKGNAANVLSLYGFLNHLQENLIAMDPAAESLAAGQAGGATAAYASFFKRKTSESNLKAIQGELIGYKLDLVPFADVSIADSNRKAIQFAGLTGLLKAELSGGKAYFHPDLPVGTEEIKETIKSYFYKAQIWFDDYKDPKMTISSTLSLVSKVGNKSSKTTEEELRKRWKINYHFNSGFELSRQISRREFAVLMNDYLNLFNVNIDKTGRVIR